MDSTTLWVLCPQWQYDNIVDLMNQIPTEKKKETICFFFRKKYPHFLLFHLWNHTTVTYIMSKLFFEHNFWGKSWFKQAQAIWLQNTLLLPQRVKSNSVQGLALLSFGEKPCPLSLSYGFFTIQPSPSEGTRLCRAARMFERSEFRSRLIREKREWCWKSDWEPGYSPKPSLITDMEMLT